MGIFSNEKKTVNQSTADNSNTAAQGGGDATRIEGAYTGGSVISLRADQDSTVNYSLTDSGTVERAFDFATRVNNEAIKSVRENALSTISKSTIDSGERVVEVAKWVAVALAAAFIVGKIVKGAA